MVANVADLREAADIERLRTELRHVGEMRSAAMANATERNMQKFGCECQVDAAPDLEA